jgi:CPA1 family monovalent cation:H+ antiporter
MLVVHFSSLILWLGIICIVIVLLARLISVAIPIFVLRYRNTFEKHAVSILTWGGLRGGISVTLSIPKSLISDVFVSVTYIIVLFSIVVQGLTIGRFAKRLAK